MVVQYERPYSYAAHWARRIAYFSFLLALAAWLGHRFGPVNTPEFIIISVVSVAVSAVALLLAFIGFSSLWRVGARGGKASFVALLLTLPVLGPAIYGAWLLHEHPASWEVSTDVIEEPQWLKVPDYDQMWLGTRKPRTAVELQEQFLSYPALIGHRYDGALDRVVIGVRNAAAAARLNIRMEKLPAGLGDLPAEPPVTSDEGSEAPEDDFVAPIPAERPDRDVAAGPSNETSNANEAFFQGDTTALFSGLQYDFVIRLREEEETTLADIRVASRYGQTDIGGSAIVAARFLKALDAELLGIAGD
ncbi:DUF1499 domain-containing protein [Rhizobium sp. L1K21]|uniref:DUF1499 domain-containing protein n=1 Tax=Rhizobium sp. L1K21 TaxID=2954933 RepID=UPI00209202E2|nr:DUF1499 domain-containing protein [Rhizobium sp. L1K21]MCO6186958.1 DUF1499 domain-containing protein [Rhizobium sp. L1K21]